MMYNSTRRPIPCAARFVALAAAALCLASCTDPPKKAANRYVTLPHKDVPEYLKDTVLEYTDLGGTEPFPISGYGLVANLKGTGGSRAPAAVREFIIKDMARHGFGNVGGGLDSPEDILNNKSFAIVRVDGFLPVGARASHKDPASGEADWYTWFDVRVSALPESDTASLAHGDLYATDLKVAGANPLEPGSGNVAVRAQAMGSIFINPAYALDDSTDTASARSSRRTGVVIGGAKPLENRPLFLRLRAPERRMARAIERRVNEQFQDVMDKDLPIKGNTTFLCEAEDEGILKVYVPRAYVDDWTHFAGVLKHVYMRGGLPQYATVKAEELAKEAVKPGAPLMDISYALEGLGKSAQHAITPLLTNPSPEVQFAAARAAAFIGDPAAVPVLLSIARTTGNPFRVNAVRALGQLPASPMVDRLLTQLLGTDEAMVRIEAYEVLARHKDGAIFSRVIKRGSNEKFILDIVPGGGTPMVYASRQGLPRLAVFGVRTAVDLPIMFVAMNNRLTISSVGDSETVTIYYRGAELRKPIGAGCGASIADIVSKLGGETVPGEVAMDFSYADVVAIVQGLIEQQKVSGLCGTQRQLASFVLQGPPAVEETASVDTAPLLRDSGRPQSERPGAQHEPATPTPGAAEQRPAQVGSADLESSNGK